MQYPGPHRWHPNPDFLYQPGARAAVRHGPLLPDRARRRRSGPSPAWPRAAPARRRPGSSAQGRAPARRSPSRCRPTSPPSTSSSRGAVAQATFSFDSPLRADGRPRDRRRRGDARRARPERVRRRDPRSTAAATERESVPAAGVEGGRGIGAVDMARAIRAGDAHRADRPGSACTSSTRCWPPRPRSRPRPSSRSRAGSIPSPPLPEDWDPTELTLA